MSSVNLGGKEDRDSLAEDKHGRKNSFFSVASKHSSHTSSVESREIKDQDGGDGLR